MTDVKTHCILPVTLCRVLRNEDCGDGIFFVKQVIDLTWVSVRGPVRESTCTVEPFLPLIFLSKEVMFFFYIYIYCAITLLAGNDGLVLVTPQGLARLQALVSWLRYTI